MRTTIAFSAMSLFAGFLWGCDIGAEGPSPDMNTITAAERLADVTLLARFYEPTLTLWTVTSSDVTPYGTSPLWRYLYADTVQPGPAYWFHATAAGAVFDSTAAMGVGMARISHSWFDSDSALRIAEQNGGTQFRNTVPRCTIDASLGEPLVPDRPVIWWITYRSVEDESTVLLLGIDAITGAVKLTYPKVD